MSFTFTMFSPENLADSIVAVIEAQASGDADKFLNAKRDLVVRIREFGDEFAERLGL
jgi:hypothetical protein